MPLPRRPRIGFARFCFAALLLTVPMLSGCGGPEPKAPSPTVNPHPHKFTKLKISVEPVGRVNNVKVTSLWIIGNLRCAPTRRLSGSTIQKQIEVTENVKKIDSYFIATKLSDRYLPGKCDWHSDSWGVDFMQNGKIVGEIAAGPTAFAGSDMLKLTCVPTEPAPFPPTCFMRDRQTFLRRHFQGVFNATLEIVK